MSQDTEEPIAGASVSARQESGASRRHAGFLQTGADGTFELELEPGALTLAVRAEGYAPEERHIHVSNAGASGIVVALVSGLRISGRLASPSGRVGGNLRLHALEDSPDPNEPPMQMAFNMAVADGSFVLEGLARGRYNVLAGDELAGFGVALGVPAGAEDVVITLRPAGTLDIEVVDQEGTPIDEIAVAVVGVQGHKVRGIQTGTDAHGRASLHVPAGSLHLKAVKRDELEGRAMVSIAPGGRATVQIEVVPVPDP